MATIFDCLVYGETQPSITNTHTHSHNTTQTQKILPFFGLFFWGQLSSVLARRCGFGRRLRTRRRWKRRCWRTTRRRWRGGRRCATRR
jgi:hypothetical protein